MTDVTVAPPSVPLSQPSQPSQNPSEVVINQNPINTSNPVGSQAPPAPVGDLKGSEHRPPSRREAIQAAFDRANNPQSKTAKPAEKAAPRAAEARKGHNQPPEDTPEEKLDLKKRPSDQPRGERGQFAPRAREQDQNAKGMNGTQPTSSSPALPPQSPYAQPPYRMAEHGKRDWANTPETVRGEVHRMQNEFVKAYQYYKDSYDAFKPVKQFHQMATEQGTTLAKALTNFVSIEQKLRTDPIAGLDVIVRNLGLKTPQGEPASLRDIAWTVLNQTPEQIRQIQQGNAQVAASHQIGSLHQEIQGLKSTLQQMHNQQQFTYTRSAVDTFADSHPRFDELGDLIEQELRLGFDLNTAYARADRLRPATQAAQTRNATPSAQTRTPDRSIHGNPDVAPSNGASRRPKEASASPRDAVRNALARMNGHA